MRNSITAVLALGVFIIATLVSGPALAQAPAQPPAPAQTTPPTPPPSPAKPPAQQSGPTAPGGSVPRAGMAHLAPGETIAPEVTGQLGPIGLGLMGTLHRWAALLFAHSAEINMTVPQRQEIEAIFFSHLKYAVPKQAERRVMILDIEQALTREQPDLNAVEQKVKALEALDSDMTMEGIRILQKALGALTPEQRATMKGLFRESLYAEMLGRARPPRSVHP